MRWFDELRELQGRLYHVDARSQKELDQIPGGSTLWSVPQLTAAIAAFGDALVALAEQIELSAPIPTNQSLGDLIESLSTRWRELHPLLDQAFFSVFPEVETVVTNIWTAWSSVTGLPESIVKDSKLVESVRTACVFIPRALLSRFMKVAMQNLATAAFQGWSEKEMLTDASAHVEIASEFHEGRPLVVVRVVDNGRRHPQAGARGATHSGLDELAAMVPLFGAALIRPYEYGNGSETAVDLRLRYRVVRGEASCGG